MSVKGRTPYRGSDALVIPKTAFSLQPGQEVNINVGQGKSAFGDVVDHEMNEMVKAQAFEAKMRAIRAGYGDNQGTGYQPKRYLVEPNTGVITVVGEGEGELSYKDAIITSASIKGGQGDFAGAIKLLEAIKTVGAKDGDANALSVPKKEYYVDERGVIELDPEGGEYTLAAARAKSQSIQGALKAEAGAAGQPQPKKEWCVDEQGVLSKDIENGEYTLSEARSVSASIQRSLKPNTGEALTPEKIELMRRDFRDEAARVAAEVAKGNNPPGTQEPAFQIGEGNKIVLNTNAKLSMTDIFLWQMLNRQQDGSVFKDKDGTVMPLPQWLEAKKYEREEDRKDKRNDAMVGLLESGKKELPGLVTGLKNIMTSKETQTAMEKGGWSGNRSESSAGPPVTAAKEGICPSCSQKVFYASIPAVIICPNPNCRTLCFFGAPEQLKMMREQLTGGEKSPASSTDSKEVISKAP